MPDKTFFYNDSLSLMELLEKTIGLVGDMTTDLRFKSFHKTKNDYKEMIDLDKVSGRYYEFISKFAKEIYKLEFKYNILKTGNSKELRLDIINLVAELMESVLNEFESNNSYYNKLHKIGIECTNFKLPTLEYFIDELNNKLFNIDEKETSYWFWDRNVNNDKMYYIVKDKKVYIHSAKEFLIFHLKSKGILFEN